VIDRTFAVEHEHEHGVVVMLGPVNPQQLQPRRHRLGGGTRPRQLDAAQALVVDEPETVPEDWRRASAHQSLAYAR